MLTRRKLLGDSATVMGLLALTGLFPDLARAYQPPAFQASRLPDAIEALGGLTPVESSLLRLTGPDLADDGGTVPLGVSTSMPGVSMLLLLAERNPTVLVALFRPIQDVEADFSIDAKLIESSEVYAVAIMADGQTYFARKLVQVSQGACGG